MMSRINYDCLKPVRVIGCDIYQSKFVKQLLKLTLITHSTLLFLQLYYFFQTPNIRDLIKYGPFFLQMGYGIFAFVVLLLKNHLVENSMNVIELWDTSSAGNDVKLKIARESKQINMFVVINTALGLLVSTQVVSSLDNNEEGIFVQQILDKLFARQANYFMVIFKMTIYLWAPALQAHAYQIIYMTQHVKFQMYMCNTLIERLGSDVEDSKNLIRDKDYQEQVESKLEIIIDRHCEFIRWKNNTLMVMSNLIIPFTIGGIIIGISILLSFMQEMIFWHSYVTTVAVLSTALSLIAAAQFLQDESENMLLQLVKTNWYNWNTGNRKKLVLMLTNAAHPINLKFSEGFVINFKLLMFVFQALHSVLSILVKVQHSKI